MLSKLTLKKYQKPLQLKRFVSSLGIDVGSTTVKVCYLPDSKNDKKDKMVCKIEPHHGNVSETIESVVRDISTQLSVTPVSLVTGRQGRKMVDVSGITEAVAVEEGLKKLKDKGSVKDVKAVVSLGGESYFVYKIGGKNKNRIIGTFAGSKCASGTGQFFAQQLGRMDLDAFKLSEHFDEINKAKPVSLATRCSVFMKTDCTHKLNKGEATRYDIVRSLSKVMANKVVDLLSKAQVEDGQVLLIGGMINIPYVIEYIKEEMPQIDFVIPEEGTFFEAFGAATLAKKIGVPLPQLDDLLTPNQSKFRRVEPFSKAKDLVRFVKPPIKPKPVPGRKYVMGVDGGSTTTKVALIDMETKEIISSHYGRTLGDPIKALRQCFVEIKKELGPVYEQIKIPIISTTGSSRELLGVFTNTEAIYNEIIAHTVGVTYYEKDVDTIFEIGGQDAKYVYLRNKVPIDYAMNEACSAGTGSFLEESCAGDLKIMTPQEIAPIALSAEAPLKFSQHCSAFINTDIRRASQEGAAREDIVAGLVLSIGYNYLERVVGNRRVGDHIVMQGGVAKNAAVPMAVASILNKKVTVPPNPELLGAFGVGLLGIQKFEEGFLNVDPDQNYNLDQLITRKVETVGEFKCKSCENNCPIKIIKAGEVKHYFGGRCNKYANSQKKNVKDKKALRKERLRQLKRKKNKTKNEIDLGLEFDLTSDESIDFVELRTKLLFEKYAANFKDLESQITSNKSKNKIKTVAAPAVFSIHMLWPLYSNFFKQCGVNVKLVEECTPKGRVKCETDYCFPAEIAHEITETVVNMGDEIDYIFLPHLKKLESLTKDDYALFCPLSQGLPYYIRNTFKLGDEQILKPILDFTNTMEQSGKPMIEMACEQLGVSKSRAKRAWKHAVKMQRLCQSEFHSIGDRYFKHLEANPPKRPVVVLFGRAYNAFTKTTNMSIPRKFVTRQSTVIPFDFISPSYGGTDEPIEKNMYWYFGQYNLKIAKKVKRMKNVYACWITNFSCGPDAFILHYMRWIYNTKPFLVLELDSHVADAGVDTRIEAFLDIIEGYTKANIKEVPMQQKRKWETVLIDKKNCYIQNTENPEKRFLLTDPKVNFIFPPLGELTSDLIVATFKSLGMNTVGTKLPNQRSLTLARSVMSGKECLPALLVLGSILEYFETHEPNKDGVDLVFLPGSSGPCRYGQYGIFYEGLFREMGYDTVQIFQPSSVNSYDELGPGIAMMVFYGLMLSDIMRDIQNTFRALAVDKKSAFKLIREIKDEMVQLMQHEGMEGIWPKIDIWAEQLAKVPLKRDPKDAPKVYIVGEIYLRRDPFSCDPLIDLLSQYGIVCKVEDVMEWISWVDYTHDIENKKSLRDVPFYKRFASKEFFKFLKLKVEVKWKKYQHNKVENLWHKSGALIEYPSDRKEFAQVENIFGGTELGTEAVPGSCAGAVSMKHGFDGTAVIFPFACIPGRLTEALLTPYAHEKEYPIVCVENDGNPLSPTIINQIETFAYNVISRFNEKKDESNKNKKKNKK
ncbi:activator of 2-hydroxyacyl-coa-hydratase-related [Anaeramoeba flamelloides]|uniref:N-acetyl-D-glucosamine kinase n=1 Tax=Anaeramoeba flamelloides TaxID=1746091 RepID=A0AAV7YTN1_9EUKA|nr:activator of 2-hydroxyacyl-coa-hydratase-related [Anaeramoeba flamelloides]